MQLLESQSTVTKDLRIYLSVTTVKNLTPTTHPMAATVTVKPASLYVCQLREYEGEEPSRR